MRNEKKTTELLGGLLQFGEGPGSVKLDLKIQILEREKKKECYLLR